MLRRTPFHARAPKAKAAGFEFLTHEPYYRRFIKTVAGFNGFERRSVFPRHLDDARNNALVHDDVLGCAPRCRLACRGSAENEDARSTPVIVVDRSLRRERLSDRTRRIVADPAVRAATTRLFERETSRLRAFLALQRFTRWPLPPAHGESRHAHACPADTESGAGRRRKGQGQYHSNR